MHPIAGRCKHCKRTSPRRAVARRRGCRPARPGRTRQARPPSRPTPRRSREARPRRQAAAAAAVTDQICRRARAAACRRRSLAARCFKNWPVLVIILARHRDRRGRRADGVAAVVDREGRHAAAAAARAGAHGYEPAAAAGRESPRRRRRRRTPPPLPIRGRSPIRTIRRTSIRTDPLQSPFNPQSTNPFGSANSATGLFVQHVRARVHSA